METKVLLSQALDCCMKYNINQTKQATVTTISSTTDITTNPAGLILDDSCLPPKPTDTLQISQ